MTAPDDTPQGGPPRPGWYQRAAELTWSSRVRRVVSVSAVIAIVAVIAGVAMPSGGGRGRGGNREDGASPSVRDPQPGGGRDQPALAGKVERDLITTSSNANLFHAQHRAPPAPDAAAIEAFEAKIETWLNEHLNDLRTGGNGGLRTVAAQGLLDDAAPRVIAGVTTELASKKRPGLEATYRFTTAHAGLPEWVRADVYVVVDEDRTTEGASFIFVPGQRGDPVLIMAEPHPDPGRDRGRDGGRKGRKDDPKESDR